MESLGIGSNRWGWCLRFNAQNLACGSLRFGVWRLASGVLVVWRIHVWRLAFGVWRLKGLGCDLIPWFRYSLSEALYLELWEIEDCVWCSGNLVLVYNFRLLEYGARSEFKTSGV